MDDLKELLKDFFYSLEDLFEYFEDLFYDNKSRKKKKEKYESRLKSEYKKKQKSIEIIQLDDSCHPAILSPHKPTSRKAELMVAENVELSALENFVNSLSINNRQIKDLYKSILHTITEIFHEAEIDPRDRPVRDDILYHDLPLIRDILEKYCKLESKSADSKIFSNFQQEVLDFLTNADAKFESLLEETLTNDVCDAQLKMYAVESRLDATSLRLPDIKSLKDTTFE